MIGISLRRPIASRIPSGTESVMPTNVSTTVSGSPPHMSVEMDESPKTPPSIRTKKAMRVAAQPSAMMRAPLRFQRPGSAVTQSMRTTRIVAVPGRHCSSCG